MDLRLEKVVILFGNGLIEMFGMDVMKSLAEMGIDVLEYQELDTVRLEDLTSLAFSMPAKTQAVIGIGGGKVIDAAKYCGFCGTWHLSVFRHLLRAMVFPAQVLLFWLRDGRKSVPARLHMGIVVGYTNY